MISIGDVALSDARGIARIHAKAWKNTYRGIMPDEVLDGMSEEAGTPRFEARIREHLQTKPEYPFLVAVEIIGFSHAIKPEDPTVRFDFAIKAIYVDPSFQGLGAGTQLVLETIERMVKQGYRSMVIWAASQNPWRRFYEKLGGTVIDDTQTIEVGGKQIPHTIFGWDDVALLIGSIRRGEQAQT